MKDKLRQYIRGVYLIDILIASILISNIILGSTVEVKSGGIEVKLNVIDAILDNDKFEQDYFEARTMHLAKEIYFKTSYFTNMQGYVEEELLAMRGSEYGAYFIIKDKKTDKLYTNNPDIYIALGIESGKIEGADIAKRLRERGYIVTLVDNVNNHNILTEVANQYFNDNNMDYENLQNFEEIYFDSANYIKMKASGYVLMAVKLIIMIALLGLLALKIIINLILRPDNVKFKSKIFMDVIYVIKNGFKYRYPRRIMVSSIVIIIGVLLVYIYSSSEIGIIVFFENIIAQYPLKSIIILSAIPAIIILIMLKDNIDLCIINKELTKVNKDNLDVNLNIETREDISELIQHINEIKSNHKEILEEKIKDEKLKTELISNVSHDLKTPLTSIINYVEILKRDNLTEDERNEYINILDRKSQKLKTLIDDLFEMSKLNSGKIQLEKSSIDIVSFIYQSIGENSNVFKNKNINFKVNSNVEECILNLDARRFSRVLENIIINALKYSMENTRVYVDIEDNEDRIQISFKNISNYEMNFDTAEIFERFVRADKSRTSVVDGSGIGLAIAKSIVELHNGEIKIDIEGDMFKIYISLEK